jgi:hypothetical protein
MRYARLLLFVAIALASPGTAHADSGWWAWLEELSGPGPFGGPMASHALHCWTNKTPQNSWKSTNCGGDLSLNATEPILGSVRLTYGFLSSYHFSRLKAGSVAPPSGTPSSNTEPVYAMPLLATFTVRTGRAWEFGTGAGALFFSGHDVNSNARFIATPLTASWRFLVWKKSQDTKARQHWAIEGQTYLIVKGFHGTSFSAVDTGYRTPPLELNGVIGVSYTFAERR